MDRERKLQLLLAFYIFGLVASNLLGGKLMPVGFGDRGLTVSIILFPLLFLITDIVGEVCGRKKAGQFVKTGLIILIALIIFQLFAIGVPAAGPNEWYANVYNPAYSAIFSLSLTFTLASIAAFFFGQWVDVALFHVLRKREGKRHLWLRNNLSTIVGQFVDSTLWVFIAFFPKLLDGTFTPLALFSVVVMPYWLAKVLMALIDTPLVYLGVNWLGSGGQQK